MIREAAHAYARADRAVICWTLGITEHHNAVDNVLVADQPGAATGHVGQVRLRASTRSAGRTTSRAAATWARFPTAWSGSRTGPRTRPSGRGSSGPGAYRSSPRYGRNLTEMFEAMEHGELHAALRHRREPGPGRGRPAPHRAPAQRARPPRGAGHLPHPDRASWPTWCCRRRSSWCEARGHGHQQRAAGAAGAQGAGAARQRARRHLDHLPRSPGGWATTGATRRRRRSGTRCARWRPIFARDELRAAGARGRAPVALLRRAASGRAVPPQPALEGAASRARRRRSRSSSTSRRWRCRTPSIPSCSPPAGGWTPTTPACRPAGTARRSAAGRALDISPEDAERLGVARRRSGAGHLPARQRGGARPRIDRSLRAGPGVHDPPLPGRGQGQPAHHRRDRSQVRHGGVQGVRRAGRADSRRPSRRHARPPDASR